MSYISQKWAACYTWNQVELVVSSWQLSFRRMLTSQVHNSEEDDAVYLVLSFQFSSDLRQQVRVTVYLCLLKCSHAATLTALSLGHLG